MKDIWAFLWVADKLGKGIHVYLLFMSDKKVKTLTEKRFFEWHEDNVSVTLRNKGGSYGGGQKC